jgi:hypothetical protein
VRVAGAEARHIRNQILHEVNVSKPPHG